MFSEKQCNIARLMTGTDTLDEIISEEHAAMLGPNRNVAAMRIDQAVAMYGRPFSEIWELALKDFREIACNTTSAPQRFSAYIWNGWTWSGKNLLSGNRRFRRCRVQHVVFAPLARLTHDVRQPRLYVKRFSAILHFPAFPAIICGTVDPHFHQQGT